MSRIIALLFVLTSLFYVFLLNRFRIADPVNGFNREYRQFFLRSSVFRKLLFLNEVGDLRYEYLLSEKPVVLVEVDYQEGKNPDEKIEEWVEKIISTTVRKKVNVRVSEDEVIGNGVEFSDKELREIAKNSQDYFAGEGEVYLHIIYVSKSKEAVSNSGLALTKDSIFIYRDSIDGLSESEDIRERIEESTIKHEFGHQLGLGHMEEENCIMSELVEVYDNRKYQFYNIPLEYCEESLDELRRMRVGS